MCSALIDPPPASGHFTNALVKAYSQRSLGLMKYLMEGGNADANLQVNNGWGSYGAGLANAIQAGDLDIIKYLVTEAHADLNLELRFVPLSTALSMAIVFHSKDIVEFLVEGNANINLQFTLKSSSFGSALDCAIGWSGSGILAYLASHKTTDANIKHLQGPYANPLSRAICQGCTDDVQILLLAGASADFKWNNGSLLRVSKSNSKPSMPWSDDMTVPDGRRKAVVDILRKADPIQWMVKL